MLLQFSQFSPTSPPPPSTANSLRQSPHPYSCPGVMHINSLATLFPMLYFTSPWLFCNYLLVLPNPLTSSPIPAHCPPYSNHQNPLWIHNSVSVLVCFICFLDSTVDKYVLIAILLLMFLIFFLKKTLEYFI